MGGNEPIFKSSAPPADSTSSAPTLGVFNGTTASYRWPSLTVGFGRSTPIEHVELRHGAHTSSPPSAYPKSMSKEPNGVLQRPVSSLGEGPSRPLSAGSNSSHDGNRSKGTLSSGSSDGAPDDTEWTAHARASQSPDGPPGVWECTWQDSERAPPCTYQGKKQLVKRHIETTHMLIKKFVCRICDKRFAQKTSLNVHVSSRHLKDEPHKCEYGGCVARYNDPARLCRHKIEAHDYVPRASVRQKRNSPGIHPVKAIYDSLRNGSDIPGAQ
ncbi:hypothetical protein PQX77_012670 [Marasmius sp. AFHP31]|nr:hypothetical protein PQX77_012670 [Marasmius sp. AFHP31]